MNGGKKIRKILVDVLGPIACRIKRVKVPDGNIGFRVALRLPGMAKQTFLRLFTASSRIARPVFSKLRQKSGHS